MLFTVTFDAYVFTAQLQGEQLTNSFYSAFEDIKSFHAFLTCNPAFVHVDSITLNLILQIPIQEEFRLLYLCLDSLQKEDFLRQACSKQEEAIANFLHLQEMEKK